MTQGESIRIFCRELFSWFAVHKRTLPWRDLEIKDPSHKAYLILVSEVMLQQTQVSRVIILYKKFIRIFPRIEDLAKASNREVLIAWRGMGYNSRALRLRNAARAIVDPHPPAPSPEGRRGAQAIKRSWKFPTSMEDLQAISGVGHYTAAAIRNFAFDLPTPCLDTNIRRILHRFFVGMERGDGTWRRDDRQLLRLASQILDVALELRGEAGKESKEGVSKNEVPPLPPLPPLRALPTCADFHAALMDFGSLVCTKNNPKWDLFPVGMRSICKAYGKTPVADAAASRRGTAKKMKKQEPGREVCGRFIPNRIFRGRIIEELRDAEKGLELDEIGARVASDWPVLLARRSLGEGGSEVNGTMGGHKKWLSDLLMKLRKDELVDQKSGRYVLRNL